MFTVAASRSPQRPPARAAGSLSRANLGGTRVRIRVDRNLDRHRLKRVAVADKAANHRHDLTDVASDPDRDEIKSADPRFVGSKLIQPAPGT